MDTSKETLAVHDQHIMYCRHGIKDPAHQCVPLLSHHMIIDASNRRCISLPLLTVTTDQSILTCTTNIYNKLPIALSTPMAMDHSFKSQHNMCDFDLMLLSKFKIQIFHLKPQNHLFEEN